MLSLWVGNAYDAYRGLTQINGLLGKNRIYKQHYRVHQYLMMNPQATDEEVKDNCKIATIQMVRSLRRILPDFLPIDELDNTDPTIDFADGMDEFYNYGDLYEAIENLPERDKYIIMMRFGLLGSEEMTLTEIAAISGMTAENVRLRQKSAIKNLKVSLNSQNKHL
jgi:RNA polymerase sigma factor (sigma-70 family)